MYVLTSDFYDKEAAFEFTTSLKHTGFAILDNAPIDSHLITTLYQEWYDFFQSDVKHQYRYSKTNYDGYYPYRSENAKGHSEKNLMEYYHFYRWGHCPDALRDKTARLHQALADLASILLHWIEIHLPEHIRQGLSESLSDMIVDSDQMVLRINHYPPIVGNENEEAVRSYEHEDINLLTILPAATSAGLQLKDAQGVWHAVNAEHGQIIVNAGDMLQLATQGYFKSTTKRVVNPELPKARTSRMSLPLYAHPRKDVQLSPHYQAKEYLIERLTENGVY